MKVDYSSGLAKSVADHQWQTAQNVDPSDFSRITHRLRYQAAQLGLEITIQTDRQERTVSFLAWKAGKLPTGKTPSWNERVVG
jgi:hypothetical protein